MTPSPWWHVAALTLVFAAATFLFDWRAVPVVAIIHGLVAWRAPRPALSAAIAAACAWALLLGVAVLRGAPIGRFAHELAGIMQLPVGALVIVTLVFPAVLAGSAAALAVAARRIKPVT